MAFNKCNYCDGETVISAENLNCMQDAILEHEDRLDNLTPEQVGAAPAGFGLGKATSIPADAASFDAYVAPGWYHQSKQQTIAGITSQYWPLHVSAYSDGKSISVQEFTPASSMGYTRIVRVSRGGNWGEFEVDNPPMVLGVEYRTTERCEGKPVYRKRFKFTNDSTIGKTDGVTSYNVPHGISDFGNLVRCVATQGTYVLPYISSSGGITSASVVTASAITLRMLNTEWTSREWTFDLAYTKTT